MGGGAVVKSIEYDLPTTTFTITDTDDQVTEINTSPLFHGNELPPYNNSVYLIDRNYPPMIRVGFVIESGAKNISEMVIVTPVISQTHEIYFDVSGTDL